MSGPIIPDKLLARVTFEYQNRDGYISDPTLNEKVGSLNQYGGRLMIVAKPVDNLTVELRADAYKENRLERDSDNDQHVEQSDVRFLRLSGVGL